MIYPILPILHFFPLEKLKNTLIYILLQNKHFNNELCNSYQIELVSYNSQNSPCKLLGFLAFIKCKSI